MMALPHGLNVVFPVGLLLLLTGTVLHIVGQSTSEWYVAQLPSSVVAGPRKDTTIRSRINIGLWKRCSSGGCVTISDKTAALKACEAFAVLGVFASLAALCLASFYFILAILRKPQHERVPAVVLWSSIVAALFILICVIVWGTNIYDSGFGHTGYSLLLSIIGGLFVVIGGVLMFFGSVRNFA